MDFIFLRDLRIHIKVGAYAREQFKPQPLSFDIDLALPNNAVFSSDHLSDTIDYAAVADEIGRWCEAHHFRLLERLADQLAYHLLARFRSPFIRLTVAKVGILRQARQVGVSVERTSKA